MLLLARGWHCLTKKSLKMLAFSLKLEIRFLVTNNGGIVFLALMKVFIMDQYVLLEVFGWINVFVRLF